LSTFFSWLSSSPSNLQVQPEDPKYRIHPIYLTRFFFEVGSRNFSIAEERSSQSRCESIKGISSLSCAMTDLIVHDLADLCSRNLVRALSAEKEKMFGIQKHHGAERGGRGLFSTLFGGSSDKDREAGASRQPIRSCRVNDERRGKCRNLKS
jgi:hypothetical protein